MRHAAHRSLLPASPPKKRRYIAPTPEVGWHTFSHQAAAFEFIDALHAERSRMPNADEQEPKLWALEQDSQGKRSYVVATLDDFWRRYRTLQPQLRHYYELIRQGCPCNLYFDLEFCKRSNPHLGDSGGDALVATLKDETLSALRRLYFEGEEEAGDANSGCTIVDLDSSTEKKFSRHLVVRLPGAAFADALHCGRFVHALCSRLLERRAGERAVAALFVAPPLANAEADPEVSQSSASESSPAHAHTCIVDMSVYSRNRCFRLYKSAKAGKTAALLPHGWSEERLYFMSHQDEAQLFAQSLVTEVPAGARLH